MQINVYFCSILFIKMKKPVTAIRHEYMPFGSLLCAGDEPLLVYEYMFGNLERHLFGEFFSQLRLVVCSSSAFCNAVLLWTWHEYVSALAG
jgi:hypothetical protein